MNAEGRQSVTPDTFLMRDYEMKAEYLRDHYSRMWTRFNYFVTIESALLGGKVAFGEGRLSGPFLFLALLLTTIWYVMGAEDRYLAQVYREHVRAAARRLATAQWRESSPYTHVGDVDMTETPVPMDVGAWRRSWISTTRLAALIPLAVGLMWALAGLYFH